MERLCWFNSVLRYFRFLHPKRNKSIMIKLFAIEFRNISDLVQSIGNQPYNSTPCWEMPAKYGTPPFFMGQDTEGLPTLIMEVPETASPDDYLITLTDASDGTTYTKMPTAEFVGRRPVHHPR